MRKIHVRFLKEMLTKEKYSKYCVFVPQIHIGMRGLSVSPLARLDVENLGSHASSLLQISAISFI